MGPPKSIATSAAIAALLTYGMVDSAVNFNEPLPASTYHQFFRQILIAMERLWSFAHGWQPMSHIRDFGLFYAPAVQLICPLVGFALFWIGSRHKLGIDCWKPLAIAPLLALSPPVNDPWVEAARTIFILLLMVWSLRYQPDPVRRPAPASL